MTAENTEKRTKLNSLSNIALYDMYAPAVYGNILNIVPHEPIAESILQKVFTNAFRNREALHNSLRAPLTNLLNQSRDKSRKVVRALEIFRECCDGATVSMDSKK